MTAHRRYAFRAFGAILLVCVLAVAVGGGCAKRKTAETPSLSDAAAESSFALKEGSSFIIQQTGVAFEGKFDVVVPTHNQRRIVLTSYQPNVSASVAWDLIQLVLTDEARAALKAYEDGGRNGEPPKPEYGQLMESGTVSEIGLKSTHDVALPAEWQLGDAADRSSALFVGSDVYQELSRTRYSTVRVDVVGAARKAVGIDADMNALITAISDRAKSLDGKTDVDLMKAEEGRIDYSVKMNGVETTVKAIQARNWYGEMIVLDDARHPLILAFAFDPDLSGIQVAEEDVNALKGLLSYRVAEINP